LSSLSIDNYDNVMTPQLPTFSLLAIKRADEL